MMKILVIGGRQESPPNNRLISFFKVFKMNFNSNILIISFPNPKQNLKNKSLRLIKDMILVINLPFIEISSNRFKNFIFRYINYVKFINYIIKSYKPDIIYVCDFPNIYLTYIFFLKIISKLKCVLIGEWYDKNTLSNFDKIFNRKSIITNIAAIINEYFGMFSYDYILYSSDNFQSIFKRFKLKKIKAIKIIPAVDSFLFKPYPKKNSREIINNMFGQKIFSETNYYILFYMGGNFDYYFQLKFIISLRKYLDKNITIVVKSPEDNPLIEKFKAYFPENLIFINKYINNIIMPYFISSFDLGIYISDKRIINENFRYPYRMLECLACGLPILMIGNVGELARTIINYKCGIVLEEKDYNKIAKKISDTIKDKEKMALFSYNARKFAEKVSMEATAKFLYWFFKLIIDDRDF